MNTGIGDAYNLAWKLACVLKSSAPATLLDTYEAERRPVGADVVARTRAASESYGRERGGAPDRRADAQIDISYAASPFVRDDGPPDGPGLRAGDRAPAVTGLERLGVGYPVRLFEVLRGTDHVVLIALGPEASVNLLNELSEWAREFRRGRANLVRVVVVVAARDPVDRPGITILTDPAGAFSRCYGTSGTAYLIRPDGHVAWRGPSWLDDGLTELVSLVCGRPSSVKHGEMPRSEATSSSSA